MKQIKAKLREEKKHQKMIEKISRKKSRADAQSGYTESPVKPE